MDSDGHEVKEEKTTIRKIAYEFYKQNWIDCSTSREMRLDALRNYYQYEKECLEEGCSPISFDEWIWDAGYNGSLYVCFDEFCEIEYLEKDYMESILSDEYLVELYRRDIQSLEVV